MASSYTPNFNLDLYTDSDKPNLRDQYNGAITKIDGQLQNTNTNINVALTAAQDANAKATDAVTKVEAETDRATAAEDSITSNLTSSIDTVNGSITILQSDTDKKIEGINSALTQVNNSITTLNGKFPVGTANIADGSVTAAKLAKSAIDSVLEGITVRYFDSTNSAADNGNLITPPGGNVVFNGFYVPSIGILCITNAKCDNYKGTIASTNDNPNPGNQAFRLPDYIPRPDKTYNIGSSNFVWTISGTRSFTAMNLNENGYVSPNRTITSDAEWGIFNVASAVLYLPGMGATYSMTGNAYTGLTSNNKAL